MRSFWDKWAERLRDTIGGMNFSDQVRYTWSGCIFTCPYSDSCFININMRAFLSIYYFTTIWLETNKFRTLLGISITKCVMQGKSKKVCGLTAELQYIYK